MHPLILLGIAVGLAMDAFAVAVAASIRLRRVSPRQVFRFAFHFGLFQGLMPVIGWWLGRAAYGYIAAWDHWIAFGLLALVGGKALFDALRDNDNDNSQPEPAADLGRASDPTRGISLIVYSIATSIDALAVGLSLGTLGVSVWTPALVIGLITCLLTTLGMLLGSRVGRRLGRRAELAGGLILIAIGLKILLSHLLS